MKRQVYPEGANSIFLADKDYLASGGEADLYVKENRVFKIYHDPNRMIPAEKIGELSSIGHPQVVLPSRVLFDKVRTPIGFTMAYISQAHALVRFFSKSFKQQNGLGCRDILNLTNAMAQTVAAIHRAGCLLVDMNELNLLVGNDLKTPWFIDTDSYQTPSFRATAIAESIRDRQAPKGRFSEETDWFSYAILAFQLFIGVHPYKGGHPKYKASQWLLRMDHGVSVFHHGATLPPSAEPLNTVPSAMLDWFQWVFRDGGRGAPPDVSANLASSAPLMPVNLRVAGSFKITREWSYPSPVIRVFPFWGALYVVTRNELYRNERRLFSGLSGEKTYVGATPSGKPVLAILEKQMVAFKGPQDQDLGKAPALAVFSRDGIIYTVGDQHLQEHVFTETAGKLIRRVRIAATLSCASSQVFDGVVVRKIMGKTWITMPQGAGKCVVRAVPELDGLRLVDGKADKRLCIVLAEKKGSWFRVDLLFDSTFKNYSARKKPSREKAINFAAMPNGLCAVVEEDEVLELLTSFSHCQLIDKAPVDMASPLFHHDGGFWQIKGNQVQQARMA